MLKTIGRFTYVTTYDALQGAFDVVGVTPICGDQWSRLASHTSSGSRSTPLTSTEERISSLTKALVINAFSLGSWWRLFACGFKRLWEHPSLIACIVFRAIYHRRISAPMEAGCEQKALFLAPKDGRDTVGQIVVRSLHVAATYGAVHLISSVVSFGIYGYLQAPTSLRASYRYGPLSLIWNAATIGGPSQGAAVIFGGIGMRVFRSILYPISTHIVINQVFPIGARFERRANVLAMLRMATAFDDERRREGKATGPVLRQRHRWYHAVEEKIIRGGLYLFLNLEGPCLVKQCLAWLFEAPFYAAQTAHNASLLSANPHASPWAALVDVARRNGVLSLWSLQMGYVALDTLHWFLAMLAGKVFGDVDGPAAISEQPLVTSSVAEGEGAEEQEGGAVGVAGQDAPPPPVLA